jgi:Uncharacterized conserved protein (DUF2358)
MTMIPVTMMMPRYTLHRPLMFHRIPQLVLLAVVVVVACEFQSVRAFSPNVFSRGDHYTPCVHTQQDISFARYASSKDSSTTSDVNSKAKNNDVDVVTKTSWYAVELFGKVFGKISSTMSDDKETTAISYSGPPLSMQETLKRIQLDNERAYFLSGKVDEAIYSPNCVFSDPFVSFEGRDRFVANLANLGSFITKYDAKVLKYDQTDATTVQTKVNIVRIRYNKRNKTGPDNTTNTDGFNYRTTCACLLEPDHGEAGIEFAVETNPGLAMGGKVHG